jgi:hypothetical protein
VFRRTPCGTSAAFWNGKSIPASVVEFVVSAVSNTFDDPDTNLFLNGMNAYPEWI